MPSRVQLRRTAGWRKPEGVIVVSRPSRWGNPFRPGDLHPRHGAPMTREEMVECYREWLLASPLADEVRQILRGHDLACWCSLALPCHADVLLEVANG